MQPSHTTFLNDMHWPQQTISALNKFYGNPVGKNGQVNHQWEKASLVLVPVPYSMVLAWDASKPVKSILIHKKCANSLSTVLKAILAEYGSQATLEEAGLDLFGGSFAYRRIEGSHRLSTHAWGAAIDLDPEGNPLGSRNGKMPLDVVSIFEAQGWEWGGRWKHRPDMMHMQAAHT